MREPKSCVPVHFRWAIFGLVSSCVSTCTNAHCALCISASFLWNSPMSAVAEQTINLNALSIIMIWYLCITSDGIWIRLCSLNCIQFFFFCWLRQQRPPVNPKLHLWHEKASLSLYPTLSCALRSKYDLNLFMNILMHANISIWHFQVFR